MAATSLTRALRGSDKKRGSSLICALSTRFSRGFDNSDGLSAETCVNLLRASTAAGALAEAPQIAEALTSLDGLTGNFVDLVLIDIFRHDHALSGLALALLLSSAERMAPQAADVLRTAWDQLREGQARLPEVPISLAELRAIAAAEAAAAEAAEAAAAMAAEAKAVAGNGAAPAAVAAEPEVRPPAPAASEAVFDGAAFDELRVGLERLRASFVAAAGSAERVRQAYADQRRPAQPDLSALSGVAGEFDALRARVEAVCGGQVAEAGADALEEVLDQAASAHFRQHRVRALAEVTGPSVLETLLSEVREGALVGAPGLETLADLIGLGGDPDAFLERFSLQERFRQEAPDHWAPVAGAAAEGLLTLPEHPPRPPAPRPPSDGPLPTTGHPPPTTTGSMATAHPGTGRTPSEQAVTGTPRAALAADGPSAAAHPVRTRPPSTPGLQTPGRPNTNSAPTGHTAVNLPGTDQAPPGLPNADPPATGRSATGRSTTAHLQATAPRTPGPPAAQATPGLRTGAPQVTGHATAEPGTDPRTSGLQAADEAPTGLPNAHPTATGRPPSAPATADLTADQPGTDPHISGVQADAGRPGSTPPGTAQPPSASQGDKGRGDGVGDLTELDAFLEQVYFERQAAPRTERVKKGGAGQSEEPPGTEVAASEERQDNGTTAEKPGGNRPKAAPPGEMPLEAPEDSPPADPSASDQAEAQDQTQGTPAGPQDHRRSDDPPAKPKAQAGDCGGKPGRSAQRDLSPCGKALDRPAGRNEQAAETTAVAEAADRWEAAEAQALDGGRFAAAAWLRQAADRPAAEAAARRCAAVAGEMSEFGGRLSAAFAEAAGAVSLKALADDAPGRLLAWAAAVRAGLIHPTPQIAQLLDDLAPALSPYPRLARLGAAFARTAHAGAYLVPGLSGRMRDAARAEAAQQAAATAAGRFLTESPTQTIKYALATEVWKTLLQEEEPLGALLALAARNDCAKVRRAAEELERLRTGDTVDRMIDDTAKTRRANRPGGRIHSGARAKLVDKIGKGLDLVDTWVTAAREVTALHAADAEVSWVLKPLDDLRGVVTEHRAEAEAELAALACAPDPLTAAAARSAAALVADTIRLLDGGPLPAAEPAAAHLLNGDLLLCASLPLEPGTLAPRTPPPPAALIPLCEHPPTDDQWRAAFHARARLGDHEGTASLLAVLGARDRRLAEELRQRRDKLVDEARHDRSDRIEAISDLLAQWRDDGVLPQAAAARFAAAVAALGDDGRDDFGVIAKALADVEREARAIRATEIAGTLDRLAELTGRHATVAAGAARISAYAEAGDLTTARELLARACEGRPPPEPPDTIDHLERFFPRFPQAFEHAYGRKRGADAPTWPRLLADALRAGTPPADPALAALLERCGLTPAELPAARREESAEGLLGWHALAKGPKAEGDLPGQVAAALRMIGLTGEPDGPPRVEQNRAWITLTEVRTSDDSPIPAFGSRMTPSPTQHALGNKSPATGPTNGPGERLRVLLVWRGQPQQVADLLKDQPRDQTVLVLCFGVLSPEQRHRMAAACRTGPGPVAGVVDDAVLGYLACLPGPSWAAAVGLLAPFGSANPYAAAGQAPPEMFYGRAAQLAAVTGGTGPCLVYGGRRLGKSTLLRQAGRQAPGTTVVSASIRQVGTVMPVAALWHALAAALADAGLPPALDRTPAGVRRLIAGWIEADPSRRMLILLDDAEGFLAADARQASSANMAALADLMDETGHRVRVVFAGPGHPGRFQGEAVEVGPLDPQDAFDLLTRPLAALGLRLGPEAAARVTTEANNAPALIRLFADALLCRARRAPVARTALPYTVTREDVAAVWRDLRAAPGYRDLLERALGLAGRCKVIVYAMAFHALDAGTDAVLTAAELRAACEEWWPEGFAGTGGDFPALLEECAGLGMLAADGGGGYRLRTPYILTLLGGAGEIEAVLEGGFGAPEGFAPDSYRPPGPDGGERSPLTGCQTARLLHQRTGLHLVTGSAALRIDRVPAALTDTAVRHGPSRVWRAGDDLPLAEALRRAGEGTGHDLVLVELAGRTPQETTALAEALRQADDGMEHDRVLAELTGRTPQETTGPAVVLVATPELAVLWPALARWAGGAGQVVGLRRFDRRALALWADEDDIGLSGEADRQAVLQVTGGWPALVGEVVRGLAQGEGERALAACRTRLERSPEAFVRSTGVLSGAAVAAAWRLLAAQTEIADSAETLAGLLALAGADEPGHPLSEAALRAEGHSSTADLVEVLRMLGALTPRPDGRLEREEVLASATRRLGPAG
ncbi:hypothetical protein DP939_41105 [Spongiactinospora rosea]|uniref:Uncharacterized protein n=2 Tax=Spongiactinospora rosea TaxID=2248750 RepID=A0A366LMG9_9ACTN|nr:hypothetical protein DP939_41105 [Spongiactinospora rosea]